MEIIPKESSKTSKSSNTLLYFSLIFLFISIASFFVLGYFLEGNRKELSVLEMTLAKPIAPEKLALEKEILSYQRKIDDFSFLIDQQLEGSRFFTAFEKVVHPRVWFSKFSLNLEEKRVTLSGHAENLEVLKQQIFIFQNAKDLIKEVDFTIDIETIIPAEEIAFSLSLVLNPKIFNK